MEPSRGPAAQRWYRSRGDGTWRLRSLLQGTRVTYVTETFLISRSLSTSRRRTDELGSLPKGHGRPSAPSSHIGNRTLSSLMPALCLQTPHQSPLSGLRDRGNAAGKEGRELASPSDCLWANQITLPLCSYLLIGRNWNYNSMLVGPIGRYTTGLFWSCGLGHVPAASDDDIEAYSDTVTCFIRKCIEDVVPTKTICIYPNQKPWINSDVRTALSGRKSAFKSRNTDNWKQASYYLSKSIKATKRQ